MRAETGDPCVGGCGVEGVGDQAGGAAIRGEVHPQEAMKLFENEPEHPLIPLPTQAEVDRLLKALGPDETFRRLQAHLVDRRKRIELSDLDPIRQAPRPKVWRIARRLLNDPSVKTLVLLGGNRSTKSFCAAYWLLETALGVTTQERIRNDGVTFLVVSESQESSRATAQKIVWGLLPPEIKAMNGSRKGHVTYVHYSIKEGFSDDVLILPSGVEIKFGTYNQDPDEWEGRELGLKHRRALAWWADENMPLPWYMMLRRRGQYRPGWGVWSFTPIKGITNTIKEAVGSGRIRKTRVAKILPAGQVLVPGLRPGRVPFIQDGADATTRVCYYHSDLTPFKSGGRLYSDLVAELVAGKTRDYILAVYYGYTKDVAGRAWPKYTRQVHMIPRRALPWMGTNYLFMDPAGNRSWFFIWVRVAPGSPRRLFLYRDWPDKLRHGEWAVPTTRALGNDSRKGRDGDKGPAQRNPGFGVARYKAEILKAEEIALTLNSKQLFAELDPYRRHTANRALIDAGIQPVKEWRGPDGMMECEWSVAALEEFRKVHPDPVRERVRRRYIDPRAAGNLHQAEKGQRTLLTMFAEENRRADGFLEGPVMHVFPAFSGKDIDEGIRSINDLLDYDENQEIVPILNEPKLMVSEDCEQVDWVLSNYTGEGAEDDGGKDVADTLRYIGLTDEVRHIRGDGLVVTGGLKDGVT